MDKVRFCTIVYEVKRETKVTLNEYVLLDNIYYLSRKTGWCYASKDYFANILDISRQSVFAIIKKLILEGFIEKDGESRYIRTTDKWNDCYLQQSKNDTDSKESLHSSKESLQYSKESLPYINNNNYNNEINIYNSEAEDKAAEEEKPYFTTDVMIRNNFLEDTLFTQLKPHQMKSIRPIFDKLGRNEFRKRCQLSADKGVKNFETLLKFLEQPNMFNDDKRNNKSDNAIIPRTYSIEAPLPNEKWGEE